MIKKGFTVIELVVVLSIISLLTSLLLFGVSQVREAARRSQCQNRIHQSLLAIANFESAFQKMPSAANSKRLEESSPWIQILPYLEQSSLAERFSGIAILNRDTEPFIDEDFPQLKCPSDGNCKSSYRFSMGSHNIPYPVVRYEASGQGCFVYGRARAMSEFRSGLSYTACISEYSRSANPNGVGMYYFDVQPFRESRQDAAEFVKDLDVRGMAFTEFAGDGWYVAGFLHSWYNHVGTPFGGVSGLLDAGVNNAYVNNMGIVNASSEHGSLVNVGFADGSNRLIDSAIDQGVWHELGDIQ